MYMCTFCFETMVYYLILCNSTHICFALVLVSKMHVCKYIAFLFLEQIIYAFELDCIPT